MGEFNGIDELREKLSTGYDRPSQIRILSEYILQHLGATTGSKSKSTKEVISTYLQLKDKYKDFIPYIPENTFTVTLSKISGEQTSRINCLGRKQGYYLENLIQQIENIEKAEPQIVSTKDDKNNNGSEQTLKERDIYPKLKQWLFEKDFTRVADTSALKTNGKWGNPDLVGLKIEDIYGRPDVEITTIEVKLTSDSWEEWIFEAIAHTRFSNRSYFAFLYPGDLYHKLDSTELRLYAEHFKVGILILEISGNDYIKIKSRSPVTIDFENVKVIEYYQAPYNQTHIRFRKKFLQSLDILELNKLYRFGEELG